MTGNILDEGEFIKKSLSQKDESHLALLRVSEKAYQKKVNQARNAIFFILAFHTLHLANLFYFNKNYELPIYQPMMVILFIKISVFLTLTFLISKRPKLIAGIAFIAVILDVLSQMFMKQNGVNFFFFIIINVFLARAYEASSKLERVRSSIIGFGEQPTY